MEKKRFLLTAALLSVATLVAYPTCCNSPKNQERNTHTRGLTSIITPAAETEERTAPNEMNAALIRNYIEDFSEFYVTRFQESSSDMKANISQKGKEQVATDYGHLHHMSLQYALNHPTGQIAQQNLETMANEIYQRMKAGAITSRDYVDYNNPKLVNEVKKGSSMWIQLRVEHFRKLLETQTDKPPESFKELLNAAYTQEEYAQVLEQLICASDQIYEGVKQGLNFIPTVLGGKSSIDTIKKSNRRLYKKYGNKPYE
ncbi:MAG: hypothetical protein KJ718_00385 [Nanoarchaeota archaeon]|nr:hypothetical protein [Nanoarchaeota archaeon]